MSPAAERPRHAKGAKAGSTIIVPGCWVLSPEGLTVEEISAQTDRKPDTVWVDLDTP